MQKEEEINYNGKLFYFEINNETKNSKNYFSPLKKVNSMNKAVNIFKIKNDSALAITNNNELIQWQRKENSDNPKENNFNFLSKTPSYIFNKIKFKSISINSTMCLALDSQSKVMTWGHNTNGLLGLGYNITSIESPIYIDELKNLIITQISLSENHAVALSHSGIAYSWGLGKYGELGQERTIYTPFPLQITSDNLYSKVYCYNYLTCFLNIEHQFSYFGVIIRNLEIDNMNITIKSLLEDESIKDDKALANEIFIEEIENQKIIKVVVSNGFVGLLSDNGDLYVLEYKDKLTKLYTKYFCYNIMSYNNKIFGLSKIDNNEVDYYLCQWNVNYKKESLLSGDNWDSSFWKIIGNSEIKSNFDLINIGTIDENINILFILDKNENNDINTDDNKIKFEFDSKYNDSYNLRFKRAKSKNSTILNDASLNPVNRTKSASNKNYDKSTYNNSLRLNYNYSLYKTKNKNKIIIENNKNTNDNDYYKIENEENIDININNAKFVNNKENELNIYRKEIDDIIDKFINRKNNKNKSLFKLRKNNYKIKNNNDQNLLNMEKQQLFSKTLSSNNNKIKNSVSKDYSNNNNNLLNNKKNIGSSNIDDYFGKESSNIIKNDDVFSDLIEFSNTNVNYLCNNIDLSNKIYNGNNSNILINSDRTLNFSGNNYNHQNNKRNISPRFVNENDSINLNSIITAKIDKSNDFFSEYGKKQGRNNNNNENYMVRKELNKNSKGSKLYKSRISNIEIQESNMESDKQNVSYDYEKKLNKENMTKNLINCFFLDNKEKNDISKLNYLTSGFNIIKKHRVNLSSDRKGLNITNSCPNLLALKYKEQYKINKSNKIKKSKKEEIFNNIEYNYSQNSSSDKNFRYIQNEKRKINKYNLSNKDEEKINCYESINRNYLSYFCFLVKLYMKKMLFKTCIKKIITYKIFLDKKYSTKMIYRIIKRRIIFYEIKFYRRLKKIRKFYIKYEQRLNLINQRKIINTKK